MGTERSRRAGEPAHGRRGAQGRERLPAHLATRSLSRRGDFHRGTLRLHYLSSGSRPRRSGLAQMPESCHQAVDSQLDTTPTPGDRRSGAPSVQGLVVAGAPSALMALQRAAGNRAVAALGRQLEGRRPSVDSASYPAAVDLSCHGALGKEPGRHNRRSASSPEPSATGASADTSAS
jgi:hypothetical protein